ncbi:MAG: hypothetical protein Q9218_005846 [Villophora microphyllina]
MDELPPPPYSLHDPSNNSSAASIAGQSCADAHNAAVHISGAAYFAMRPPPDCPRPASTRPCHIAVLPDTVAADLPMPEPIRLLIARDVYEHDWLSFVNHLVPYTADGPYRASAAEKSVQLSASEPAKVDGDALNTNLIESDRQRIVGATVHEWNKGFFLPRGVEIVVRMELTPSQHVPAAGATANRRTSNTGRSRDTQSIQRASTTTDRSQQGASQKSKGKANKDAELGMALYRAVEKQEVRTAQILLEAGADPDTKPSWATPAIVEAVKKGNTQLLEMLLAYGAKVDVSGPGDGTALYTAVSKQKTDMVELLLKHGANPNERPSGGEPAIYRAVTKQYDEIVDLLLQTDVKVDDTPPGGTTAMYQAAKKDNASLVKRLLAAGAKVDARPMGSNTAMYEAAKTGNINLVKQLLDSGAEADARPMGSNTAMFEAAKKGNYEVCQLLLQHGAQVDARTTGGNTALWNIISKNDEKLVRLLLDHGADIGAKTWGGETVLERAVNKGKHDMVELLLKYKH